MDIDVYQHCPCHSGKKIKFCCGKDVVNDLNEIVAKNKGGQPLAALSQLERVIEKHGPLNCLLTIQTHILISQGEIEKAKASNDLYMQANPDQPIGHQHQALIAVAEGDSKQAVKFLQDTMDAITGNQIPLTVAHAFRMVGLLLFSEGQVLAARAHLQFANILKDQADEELQRMLYETFRIPEASILLKHDYRIAQPPKDKEWGPKYANVIRAMDRGQFRKALQFLHRLDKLYPDEKIVVHAIAVLNSFLGNVESMADSWRRYSQLESVSTWDAIEAEALAQVFATEPMTDGFDIVRTTYEISDFELVSETAVSSPRLSALAPLETDPFEEGPAPRACYYFLDRARVENADDLTLENVSSVTGEILLYGKQTDRPGRLEWITTRNKEFDGLARDLVDIFKDGIAGDGRDTILGTTTEVADVLSWNWQLPQGITKEKHTELMDEQRRGLLYDGWAGIQFSILDGMSPRDAAQNGGYEIQLSALILHLEQSPDAQVSDRSAVTGLRDQLGVSQLPSIDPNELDDAAISPLRQQYLEFEKLTDDHLLQLHAEAMAIANIAVLQKLIPELLNREHLNERVPRDVSLSMLAQLTEDEEKAFALLQQAKTEAKEAGRPLGIYLVQELEMRMVRGMTDKLPGLLQRIQAHHLREPNVEYQLTRVLSRFGLLDRQSAGQEMETVAVEDPSGVWTPDQEGTAPAQSGAEEPAASKLWLPGSD